MHRLGVPLGVLISCIIAGCSDDGCGKATVALIAAVEADDGDAVARALTAGGSPTACCTEAYDDELKALLRQLIDAGARPDVDAMDGLLRHKFPKSVERQAIVDILRGAG